VGEQVELLEDHADVGEAGPKPDPPRVAVDREEDLTESMGSSRLIVLHSVDLPDPDGPMSTTTSPRSMVRSMSRRT
jgi:hypothetical protein